CRLEFALEERDRSGRLVGQQPYSLIGSGSVRPCERLPQSFRIWFRFLLGFWPQIPHQNRAIVGTRQECPAVGTEGDRKHPRRMARQLQCLLSCSDVPEAHGAAVIAGSEPL